MSRLREAEAVASSAAAEAQAARAHADACQSQLAMARLEEGVNKELAGQVRGWEAFYTGLGKHQGLDFVMTSCTPLHALASIYVKEGMLADGTAKGRPAFAPR